MPIPRNLDTYQSLYPEADVIKWDELFRSQKSHRIRPDMLTDGGECLPVTSKLVGDTLASESILRLVIFDRHYAIAKLAVDNREIGKHLTCEQFQQLMEFVYDKIQSS
jgi:hypothetical protein